MTALKAWGFRNGGGAGVDRQSGDVPTHDVDQVRINNYYVSYPPPPGVTMFTVAPHPITPAAHWACRGARACIAAVPGFRKKYHSSIYREGRRQGDTCILHH